MKYSSLENLRMVRIDMESENLVNLHIALENEFPIPEDTLIALVRNQFSLDNWYPNEDDGFILIDEENDMFDDEIIHYYVDQTQEFYLNARRMLDETEPSEMSDNQQQFKEFRDNEVIENIQQELNLIRLDYISFSDNRDFSANSYIDAWININDNIGEDKLPMLERASSGLRKYHRYVKELTELYKYELIFALDTLIEKEPKGPIATYKVGNYGDKESTNKTNSKGRNVGEEFLFKIIHLELILNLCIENVETRPYINKLIHAIEHMKARISFSHHQLIDLEHKENLQIIENRIQHYFDDTENCRTGNEISRYHVQDILTLLIIKGKAIERYGSEYIIGQFDKLIQLNNKDKKYCQSIKFIRDNYCLDGKERIDSLVKHEANTHSKFLNGLINYFIGASLELGHNERIPRLLKAMDIFYGADTLRFEGCLKVLVGGYVDTKDNNGNPFRDTTLKQKDDMKTISRITKIISQLDPTNSAITYMVVWDIHDYLVARITRHLARCGSCDYPHMYIDKWELHASIEQVSALEKVIYRLLDSGPNDEIKNNLLGLIECAYIMKVSLLGMRINFDSDEFIHETTRYTNDLVKNPVNVTVSRYDFSAFKTKRIYEDIGSLILHLSEPIFTEEEKVEALENINRLTVQELDDTNDVSRKGLLRLAIKCFDKMLEVDSSKWMQVFGSISLVELDEQLMKVPNLSESEFGKILTIAKHAHSIGIYDSITKNSEAEEEHSEAIFNIIQQMPRFNIDLGVFENLQPLNELQTIEEVVNQIEDVVYPIVKNPYINLIQDVSKIWSSETRPHFMLLNLVIRVFKDVEKLLTHHEKDELPAEQFDLGLATIMSKHNPEMMHLMILTGEDFSEAVD